MWRNLYVSPLDDDRVPGVRAALVAADEVGVLGEQVDDLALALVAPLRADDDGRRHARSVPIRRPGAAPPAYGLPIGSADACGCARGRRGCMTGRRRDVGRDPRVTAG